MPACAAPYPALADRARFPAGLRLVIRPMRMDDVAAVQAHVRALSRPSRHSRFLGGVNGWPTAELERIAGREGGRLLGLVAETQTAGLASLVGEAVMARDGGAGACEFALSVADAWQGRGIGTALVASLARRAAQAGADLLFGEALRTNEAMRALAAKTGFAVRAHPGERRLIRLERPVFLGPPAMPCAWARPAVRGRQAAF